MAERVLQDLLQLPRVEDSWTFLYTDKVRIQRADYSIELCDRERRIPVPVAALSALILGPGATITHAAVLALAESGCSIVWAGEGLARFYASGLGETRRTHNLEAQARAWADADEHMTVVRRMYSMRFSDPLPEGLTLQQIRGREGVRVRQAYAELARETGIEWHGRDYKRDNWYSATPVNRALSAANACLYGVCHAAIVATGFSPALGFIHTGKSLSFVYDIADLYKVDVTVPAAFRASAARPNNLESHVRRTCRELFMDTKLIERVVPDMQRALGLAPQRVRFVNHRGTLDTDRDATDEELEAENAAEKVPAPLWNPRHAPSPGGQNYAPEPHEHSGPSVAKVREPERGDAYEDDLTYDAAAGDDDDGAPF